MKQTILLFLGVLWILLFSGSVYADLPTDILKDSVDKILAILKDEAYKGEEKKDLKIEKIKEVIYQRFNFEEMAKRSLAIHWRDRTDEEKREFTQLFRDLLESRYRNSVEKYNDEEIAYLNERVDGRYCLIKTEIIMKDAVRIPVDYKMLKNSDDEWQIYDVVVEGVSLVNNYRTQFNSIIRSKSYEELLTRLKEKVANPEGEE